MTPERFRVIDRIFQGALDLEPRARSQYLDEQCAGDDTLRADVEALLDEEPGSGEDLANAIHDAAASFQEQTPDGVMGRQIGPYLLVGELGRGGMGAVYHAIRTDGQFHQTVAIKLMRAGLDSGVFRQRFLNERQILAALDHPNIARLLDGGSTRDGEPYFVMEFIHGEPLPVYCAARSLSVRDRLRLFLVVCDAVEHAHEQGIIHRDLKPGNILVTAKGKVKLLDFGIAKLADPELWPAPSPETLTGARMLTPEYASPEQMRGAPVTPASDIYSLGAVLYELLTGAKAHGFQTADPADQSRVVNEVTPPRPSTVIRRDAPHATEIRRQIAGDLDNIVMMALRKEPERRYGSVEAFSDDIKRFLDGAPVAARMDTAFYRISKFVRKRKMAVAASVLIVCGATATAVGTYAWKQAPASAEVLSLVERAGLLMQRDPRTGVLGKGIPQPVLESIELYRRAAQLDPRHAPAWLGLAETAEFAVSFDQSREREMLVLALDSIGKGLALDPQNSKAWELLGIIRSRQLRFAEARTAFQRAVALNPRAPYAVRAYANILEQEGRHEEALRIVDVALEQPADPNNPDPHAVSGRDRVILLTHRAHILHRIGRNEEAVRDAREALTADAGYRLAYWVAGLAYEGLGRFEEAEREFRIAERLAPEDQRLVASLGHLLARMGKREEALSLEAKLSLWQAQGRPVGCGLAVVALAMGRKEPALAALERAWQEREPGMVTCLLDPRLRPLSNEPRYQALRRQGQPN